jgi:hypothetical protein
VAFTEIWTSLREVDLAVKRVEGWMEDESGVKDTILAFKLNSQSSCGSDRKAVGVGLRWL